MPKSISTIQGQISTCEDSIQLALSEIVEIAGNEDMSFTLTLKDFINDIHTCDIEQTSTFITQARNLLQQCEKIATLEKKRREYARELQKVLADREKRESVKRVTRRRQVKKKVTPTKPSLLPSVDEVNEIE